MDNEKWIAQIRRSLEYKSTEELLQIWEKNDHNETTDEAFIAIRQILEARGEDPGSQSEPGSQAEPAQASERERPGCVTAFVILMGLSIVLSVLGSLAGFLGSTYIDTGSTIGIVTTLIFAGLYIAVTIGLWQLKNWARIAVIVLLIINILLMIALLFNGLYFVLIGLAIGAYTIYWFAVNGKYFVQATPPEKSLPTQPASDS